MDGLKLKSNELIFVGAYVQDENNPVVGQCVFSLQSKTLTILSDSKTPIASEKTIKLDYRNPNQFISILNFSCEKSKYSFHVGIFPEESYPIDNVTDSIKRSFIITDSKEVMSFMQKNGPHSIIKYMADMIQSYLH